MYYTKLQYIYHVNGGTCQYHAGTYICHCLSGFMGGFCEEKITDENTKTRYVWTWVAVTSTNYNCLRDSDAV